MTGRQPQFNQPLNIEGTSIKELWEASPDFLTCVSGRVLRYNEERDLIVRADEMLIFQDEFDDPGIMVPASRIETIVTESVRHFSLLSRAGLRVVPHAHELDREYNENTNVDPSTYVCYSASVFALSSITVNDAVLAGLIDRKRVQKEVADPTLRYIDNCIQAGQEFMLADTYRIDEQNTYSSTTGNISMHDIDPRVTECTPKTAEDFECVVIASMQKMFD